MEKLLYVYLCLFGVSLAIAVEQLSCPASQCCRNGRDGRDGINGINGANGADGKDGRNGKHGINGINGKDGRNGINGIDGKDGKNGKDGEKGKDGMNGKDGKNGIDGKNGNDGAKGEDGMDGKDAIRNWKQCAWRAADGKDNGVIKTCSFVKKRADTHLKIVVNTNMRVYNCDSCCKRWFITINGQECTDPVTIDGVVYMWKGKGTGDLHRPRVIRGVCKISSKGTMSIALNVGNCPNYGDADAHTGWNSSSNIYIEELDPPQA